MSTLRLICSSLLMFCIGCSHPQTVTARYPFWGEAVFMKVPGSDARRSMQVLAPKAADSVKGCLLIVHGMNEHIGRYGDVPAFCRSIYCRRHGLDRSRHE